MPQTPQTAPRDAPARAQGAKGTALPSGTDVSSLMPGQDVTDLMNQPPPQTAPPAPRTFGDSLLDFAKGVGEQVNPLTLLSALYQGVTHPIDTATGLVGNQLQQFKDAKQFYDKGQYSEAYGATVAGLLPILGPQARQIGETIGSGDIAHGLGQATGLVGLVAGPALAKGAGKAAEVVGETKVGQRVAQAAEDASTRRMVDVMAPKVGPNKMRFAGMAEDVAPELASMPGMASRSRLNLARKVGEKLTEAEAGLDAAADARNPSAAYPTAPILADLKKARAALTAEAVDASHVKPAMTGSSPSGLVKMPEAVPIGKDVVPSPNAGRVAQIDQAISEIEQLGPIARYESLRRIRAAYDQVAKVKYSPSMTADFLSKNAEASGAADVTRAIREHLATMDPQTAAANTTYSLFRKADDVLTATEEIERSRPKVGRSIVARLGGTIAGAETGGVGGAVAGAILAPIVDELLNAGPTTKITSARMLQSLSTALKSGDTEAIVAAVTRARSYLSAAKAIDQTKKEDK